MNAVWLGGLRACGFAALNLGPFGAREPSQPTRQTGFRLIWLLAADEIGWLDGIMYAGS